MVAGGRLGLFFVKAAQRATEKDSEHFLDSGQGLADGFQRIIVVGGDVLPAVAGLVRKSVEVHKHLGGELGNGLLAGVLARTGNSADRKEAEGIYRDLREQMTNGIHYDEGWLAETAIVLGKEDEALELLRKAADGKGRWSMITLRKASNIKRMGHLPGYWEVVDQLKFPELPIGHPYRAMEQEMRYGKRVAGPASVPKATGAPASTSVARFSWAWTRASR